MQTEILLRVQLFCPFIALYFQRSSHDINLTSFTFACEDHPCLQARNLQHQW